MARALVFIAKMSPYNEGEIAGFEEPAYSDMIKRGIAVPYEPKSEASTSSEASEASESKAVNEPPADKMVRGSITR